MLRQWQAKLSSDTGTIYRTVWTVSKSEAIKEIMNWEKCPKRAIKTIREIVPTPSELKHYMESEGVERHFFTRQTMRFFGDTMRNYGVRDAGDCWELYRKKAVKHGLKTSTYFAKGTLKRVLSRE